MRQENEKYNMKELSALPLCTIAFEKCQQKIYKMACLMSAISQFVIPNLLSERLALPIDNDWKIQKCAASGARDRCDDIH